MNVTLSFTRLLFLDLNPTFDGLLVDGHENLGVQFVPFGANEFVGQLVDAIVGHPPRSLSQIFVPIRIRLVLHVLQHGVSRNFHGISSDFQTLFDRPMIQIVVFPAPTEKRVGESVDELITKRRKIYRFTLCNSLKLVFKTMTVAVKP